MGSAQQEPCSECCCLRGPTELLCGSGIRAWQGRKEKCEHQEAVGGSREGQQGAPKQQGCAPSIALLQGVPQPVYNPVPRVPQGPHFT